MTYTCVECCQPFDALPGSDLADYELCPRCFVPPVYCPECSKAGGADRAVYHLPPACRSGSAEKTPCPDP